MHPRFKEADALSHHAIGAAIEVHRLKGPGLIERVYERCMMRELSLREIDAVSQQVVRIEYKGYVFEEPLRFDVLIRGCLLLELKSVQEVLPVHKAQLLSYMRLLDVPIGLLINFHELRLVDGVHRLILPGANSDSPTKQIDNGVETPPGQWEL
jgi:GxxExxY protein